MARNLRVAIVAACPFPDNRGTPIRILRMAEAIQAQGVDIHVVAYHLGRTHDEFPFSLHRTKHTSLYKRFGPGPTYRKLWLDMRLAKKLQQVVREQNIDVIHAHHYEGLLAALMAHVPAVPVIYDAHTMLESELPSYALGMPGFMKRRLGRLLDRILPRRANYVIAASDTLATWLLDANIIAQKDLSMIPNGVELAQFNSEPRPPGRAEGPKSLIYTGNLAAYQGVNLMLAAFSRILVRRPDVTMKIVTGSETASLERECSRLNISGSVLLAPGDFAAEREALRTSDIALNPRTECPGIPQKLLNYMAAACPIVSFEGSARHLTNGRSAIIVPDGDVEAFARAVLTLLDDPDLAKTLGENARNVVEDDLSWERTAKLVIDVYRKFGQTP